MRSYKNLNTLYHYFSIVVFILLILNTLSACSSNSNISLQTDPIPTTSQRTQSPLLDPTTYAPINLTLPDEQPIASIVTHDGISIAITWAYADTARIGIEYRIQGIIVPEGYHLYCPISAVTLNDDSGKEYEKYIWPAPTAPSENFEIHCKRAENGNDYIITQNYYGVPSAQSQSLSFTLSIELGGFNIYMKNGAMTTVFPYVGPFTFHFELPISGSLTLDTNLTQSNNGMVVTLSRMVISPTVTDAFLCISYDNHKGWYPDISISWEGSTYKTDETLIYRMDVYHKSFPTYMDQFTTERCYRYSFFLPYQANANNQLRRQMVLSLQKMVINAMDALTQDDCRESLESAQRTYPELDFSCNIDTSEQGYSVGININKLPPGMDYSTAIGIADDGFISVVDGPINFIINVP